ncbi:tRNA (adenosine(37)-N6)-threonylcarbamoyltransferase complex ATPase subunit type 1 TsaE [Candidatus Binatus sp.]|uniref:tRNA (adenosine(37)-N6)-threonylcarbamoyltransferase complex ATPase subunit type 1 TsaE n=1 Tax=Candidatus Binatus sp. TaxID=2811406 RepID=UPI003C4D9C70
MTNAATNSGAVAVTMVIESRSPHETKSWGRRLASILEGGELLGLIGDLGAGKTCFIKGLARGLSLREEDILSPTFTMIQEHHGRFPLYHIDLYRLEEATLDDLGLREYLFSEGVAAVEWFERLRGGADMEYLSVRISYAGANLRRIELSAIDSRHAQIISKLKRSFA